MFIFGAAHLTGPDYVKNAQTLMQTTGSTQITVLIIQGFVENHTASLHQALNFLRVSFTPATVINLVSLLPVSAGVLSLLSSAAGVAVKNQSNPMFAMSAEQMQAQIINEALKAKPAKASSTTLRQQAVIERQRISQIMNDVNSARTRLSSSSRLAPNLKADEYIRK